MRYIRLRGDEGVQIGTDIEVRLIRPRHRVVELAVAAPDETPVCHVRYIADVPVAVDARRPRPGRP